jgi:uncharacterized protein (TIGR03437 family)
MRITTLTILPAIAVYGSTPKQQLLKNLPLRFEEAGGSYTARGPDFVLTLAPGENRLDWTDSQHHKKARVTTRLVNGNPMAPIWAEDRLPGAANYFLGSQKDWRTDVTGFGRVRYHEIYPGIDLIFHGENGRLEYDFIVAPDANPGAIRLELSGQQSIRIGDDGDLVIATAGGEVRWKAPEVYQEIGGVKTRVDGKFVRAGKQVAFKLGAYDRRRELVIDPVLSYSTYIGGTANEAARGIAVDSAGNVYIGGSTSSQDLHTASAVQPNFGGLTAHVFTGDGFVAKFGPSGSLLYLTYLGGSRDDGISAIAVDSAGNAYVTGGTTSTDFPTMNPFQSVFGGMGSGGVITGVHTGDAFVAKLSPTGNKLLYSTYLGGSLDDVGLGIALDSKGDAFVTGATASLNFPVTPNAQQGRELTGTIEPAKLCCNGPFWVPGDAFMAEFDPTGSQLLYATYLGGEYDDAGLAIAVDASSNVYVAGCTTSQGFFPTTAGAYQRHFGGIDSLNTQFNFGDGFVTKYNSSGKIVYSTYVGGPGDDCVNGIAVDSAGDVYMVGSTTSNGLATAGAFQSTFNNYTAQRKNTDQRYGDAFVAELNPAGSAMVYFTYLGGASDDTGTAIVVDGSGNAIVTGYTNSVDFPLVGLPLQKTIPGNFNHYSAFLALVNPSGSSLLYSTYFGGSDTTGGQGLALDAGGKVYLTGSTLATDFPTTSGAFQHAFGGVKRGQIGSGGVRAGALLGDAFYSVFAGFGGAAPVITSVTNAFGDSPTIAPNTWVAIKGNNLAPDPRTWGNSDFVNGQLPTMLDTVSVTMGGKNAFVYFISQKQLNVLTPPDLPSGPIQVQVSNGGVAGTPFSAQSAPYSISFFVFNGGPYVIATHLDGSLVGPTSLFPGATTPAKPGETIILYANGFGPVNPPVVSGSIVQSGTIQGTVPLQIGGMVANISFAGVISPGLFQFNVVIPSGAQSGDNSIQSEFGGEITPAGTLITIQQ